MSRMAGCLATAICLAVSLGPTMIEAQEPRGNRTGARTRPKPPRDEESLEGVERTGDEDQPGEDLREEAEASPDERDVEESTNEESNVGRARSRSGKARRPADDPPSDDAPPKNKSKGRKAANKAAPKGPPFANAQLPPREQAAVDAALEQWESKTKDIDTLSAEFRKWEYEGDGPLGPGQAVREAEGEIKYAQPDKGRYRILGSTLFGPPLEEGGPLHKIPVKGGEYWLSDGKAIYEYRQDTKEMVVRKLPPELQGKEIVNGPLPFVFGVEAEKLAERFFIQIVTPQGAPVGEIWLEMYPRKFDDWLEYDHIVVILSEDSMLPKAIEITKPNQTARESYEFIDPKVNGIVDKAKDFFRVFIPPKLPKGWKRVALPFGK